MSLRLPRIMYITLCGIVMVRDGYKCRKCGYRENLHCHHIKFRSEGGLDTSWNLITLCSDCHDAVHAYKVFISAAEGNFVGEGGGADGGVIFTT
jgi:hypothetical protein